MSEVHQIEAGSHLQWLAEQARMFADAKTPEQIQAACMTNPGTRITAGVDTGTSDGYHEVINAAAGQMQAICGALADAILGKAQS